MKTGKQWFAILLSAVLLTAPVQAAAAEESAAVQESTLVQAAAAEENTDVQAGAEEAGVPLQTAAQVSMPVQDASVSGSTVETAAQSAQTEVTGVAEAEILPEAPASDQIAPAAAEPEVPAAAGAGENKTEAGAAAETPEKELKAAESTETPETAKTDDADSEEEARDAEEEELLETAGTVTLEYQTHVQTYGWEKEWKKAGEMSGTMGESKRLEGIRIRLDGAKEEDYIEYRTHVQTYGWETAWARNGDMSGTSGESKRLEGIQIRLSPSLEESYDLYYCVHAQTYGWLGWAKNGQQAGTEGLSRRLEGIKIVLVNKGDAAPDPVGERTEPFIGPVFRYQTHVQTYGWQDWVSDGQTSGTFGQSKRLEGICIEVNPSSSAAGLEGSVEYRTHVQTYGWETAWKRDGEMSGTSGESKRLEGIEIRLTGELAEKYDIYYRVHAQTYGWLGWAKNGEPAGTEGMSKRLEGIQIVPVLKGGAAPGSTFTPYRKPMSSFTVPYAQPTAGSKTIRNLLRTALVPCGRTLYQWGGGHGPDANQEGMPQQWVDYFESHSTETWEPDYSYISYWNGVDCSGYSSWVVANTTGNYAGTAPLAQNVAQMYSGNGWTHLIDKDNTTFRPGDFVSVLYGHIWISLGQCSDGSVLFIHSAGNGIQLSGTGGQSMELANYYMQKYFPYWPYGVVNYDWLLEEPSQTARWITNGSGLLTDPDGMQKMSADQVMKVLLGD